MSVTVGPGHGQINASPSPMGSLSSNPAGRPSGQSNRKQSPAVESIKRIANSLRTTHVATEERLRLKDALDDLCRDRPDLKRLCERALAIAVTCSLPIESPQRQQAIGKLKEMVVAIAEQCDA